MEDVKEYDIAEPTKDAWICACGIDCSPLTREEGRAKVKPRPKMFVSPTSKTVSVGIDPRNGSNIITHLPTNVCLVCYKMDFSAQYPGVEVPDA